MTKSAGWLFVLWLLLSSALHAAPLVEVSEPELNLPLTPYIDILEDTDRNLSIEDVLSERYTFRFASAPLTELFFGYTRSAYWIRFTVENQLDKPMPLVLEAMPADIDYLDLYEVNPLTRQLQTSRRMGAAVPYTNREYDHPLYFFDINLMPKTAYTYYLRVESNKTINLQLHLSTPRAHLHNTGKHDWWQGLLLGGLILLSIIHFSAYLLFRAKGFLWCSLFLCSVAIIQISWNGYLLQFFDTSDLLLDHQIITPVYLAILFSSLFVQSLLNTRKRSPWQHHLLSCFAIFSLLAAITTWFIDASLNSMVASVLALLSTLTIFTIALQANMEGMVTARYFLLARTLTTGVILIAIFNIHGYLPQGSFTAWGVSSMVILESVLMLSVMLADCLQDLRKQPNNSSNTQQDQGNRPLINLADICHELRTPISGILGMTDLLMEGNLSDQQINQLKTMRKSGQALLDVTVVLSISAGLADDIIFSIRSGNNTLIDRTLSNESRQFGSSDQLNITIAEEYLKLMGSVLSLHSHIGEGISIEFHIALEAQIAPYAAEAAKESTLHGKRMLVVDDNATCCAITEQQAIQWGMIVTSAHGGKEALAILRSNTTLTEPFDIVLTDYDMPSMNGLEMAEHIRQDRKINSEKLLIVMLTGVSTAPSQLTAENADIQAILYKPLSGKSLKLALQNALATHLQSQKA